MDRRRLKALQTVKRLRKMELDQEAAALSEIRAEESAVRSLKEDRTEHLKRDTASFSVEYSSYIRRYVESLHSEIRGLDEKIASLGNQSARQERVVLGRYSKFRAVDLYLDKAVEADRIDAEKKESSQADELSILRYRRKDF